MLSHVYIKYLFNNEYYSHRTPYHLHKRALKIELAIRDYEIANTTGKYNRKFYTTAILRAMVISKAFKL